MEKGDPTVSMPVYATALWFMGRDAALPDLAAPEHDRDALEQAIRVAKQRSVWTRTALEKRLAGAAPGASSGKRKGGEA